MPTVPNKQLRRLVALKRQRAERAVLALAQEVARLEAEISDMRSRLSSTDNDTLEFEPDTLLFKKNFVEWSISEIQRHEFRRSKLIDDLERAKHDLRRSLLSESQLEPN